MSELHALVYVSQAAHALSLTEIDHLLGRAQARNRDRGVTGVLLYSDRHFMQYLEGPLASMAEIYGIIRADRQHHGLIELLRDTVRTREFPDWAMAFRSTGAGVDPNPALAVQSVAAVGLSRPTLYDDLRLPCAPTPAARMLLSGFWNLARQRAAF